MLGCFGEDGEEDGAGKDACAVVGQLGGPVDRYHKISDTVIITKLSNQAWNKHFAQYQPITIS